MLKRLIPKMNSRFYCKTVIHLFRLLQKQIRAVNMAPMSTAPPKHDKANVNICLIELPAGLVTSLSVTLGGNVIFTVVKLPSIAPPETLRNLTKTSIC